MRQASEILIARGDPLWLLEGVTPERLVPCMHSGELFLIRIGYEVGGTFLFQGEDVRYWPDVPSKGAASIHRLVVAWAGEQALQTGPVCASAPSSTACACEPPTSPWVLYLTAAGRWAGTRWRATRCSWGSRPRGLGEGDGLDDEVRSQIQGFSEV